MGAHRPQCAEGKAAVRPRTVDRRLRHERPVTFTGPHLPGDETPERRAEVRRLADALRSVIERFVATTAPLEVFHGVADDLEEIAARLSAYPQEHLFTGFAEARPAGDS